MFEGHVMVGGSLSATVTANWQLLLYSAVSTALYASVVWPIENSDPLLGPLPCCCTPGQLSLDVTV